MPEQLVTVTIARKTGLVKDQVVNNFAIETVDPVDGDGERTAIALLIEGFYNGTHDGGGPLASLMSPALSRAADDCVIRFYDVSAHLNGSNHGSPVALRTFTLAASAAADPLPAQVACVLTLEASGRPDQPVEVPDGADADAKPDRPRQRYTGRLYLGPWNVAAQEDDANFESIPSAQLRGRILAAAGYLSEAFVDQAATTNGAEWKVWSRKDATFREVDHVSIDDGWDTVRSRRRTPTARTRVNVVNA